MDNSYTSSEFLFSFKGRINRAKYWYAVFASSAFCGVLLGAWGFALSRIFGASIKSVHLNFLDIAPFSITFSDAGPGLTENLISLLFYAGGTPMSCSACGSWRPPRSSGFTTAINAAGGLCCCSLREYSIGLRAGFPIPMRWASSNSSHSFFASGALLSCSA
jgi:hypothetical protein